MIIMIVGHIIAIIIIKLIALVNSKLYSSLGIKVKILYLSRINYN